MTRWSTRFTPADRVTGPYRYVPIPVGPRGVRIELRTSGGVVDLGVVDPMGWRGWSGGARRTVLIGPDAATPGYVDRGVPDGEWSVVLGLHRVPPGGVDVQVTAVPLDVAVPVEPLAAPGPRPPRRVLPAPDGRTWFAGDLHAHTVHSDGVLPLDVLAARAVGAGLDVLAVTDHNTVSHHPLLPASASRHGITLLPGQEVTTADGHANALGDIGWVDVREPAAAWAAAVAARGGVLSVNHPVAGDCAWRHPLDRPPALAEIWHGPWRDRRDGAPLAWWRAAGGRAVGGSDFHRPGEGVELGVPTTWIAATSAAVPDVLAALAAGRVTVSATRDGPVLLSLDDELVAVDADGAVLVCPSLARTPVVGARARFPGHHGPHVLETPDREVLSLAGG